MGRKQKQAFKQHMRYYQCSKECGSLDWDRATTAEKECFDKKCSKLRVRGTKSWRMGGANSPKKLAQILHAAETNLNLCKKFRCAGKQLNFLQQSVSTRAGTCISPANIISCDGCMRKLREYC